MMKHAAKYHISSFSCAFHLWPGQLNSITTTTGLLFLLPFLPFWYTIFHFFCTAYFFWTTLKMEAAKLPVKVYSTTQLEKGILEWHHHRSTLVPPVLGYSSGKL